ncbi:MAG TPA: heavy-metal-associated domain-containing protein [Solirubrobacteraceae bacterium]|nr:heavy-metal-associated domain-containing protein [Solirubrobacteraceae bacterium]
MLPTRTYTVEGMTCGHCRASVIQEVLQVAGVKGADVDLESKRLTVAGESFEDSAIQAAVDEAGYTLVS